MATLTEKKIQTDFLGFITGSSLAAAVNGSVYRAEVTTDGDRESFRPRDSREEDIEVIFTGGFTSQIQEGVVTLNIYYNDIDPYGDGVYVEDGQRGEELQAAAQSWFDGLTGQQTGGYLLRLQSTIATGKAAELKQHFVVMKLAYKYYMGD